MTKAKNDILYGFCLINKNCIDSEESFDKLIFQNFAIAHEFSHFIEHYENLLEKQNPPIIRNPNYKFKKLKKNVLFNTIINEFNENEKNNVFDKEEIKEHLITQNWAKIIVRLNYEEYPYCALSRCLMLPDFKILNILDSFSSIEKVLNFIKETNKKTYLPINQIILRIIEEIINYIDDENVETLKSFFKFFN